jgi:hypothetical protein
MAIIQTVTGYVTQKGVQKSDINGSEVYRISLRDNIIPRKGEKRTVVATATFWGSYNSRLQEYIAPYDQVTLTGELTKVDILEPRDGQVDGLIILELKGLHCNFPKRDDADGANKKRTAKQRVETLKPDPAATEDEEIPF